MAKAKPVIAPRKPPRPDERDSFVTATGRPASSSKRQGAQAPGRLGGRAPIVRADGRELRKLHVYVAAATAKALAVYCAEVERDQSSVVEEAVARYLAAQR